MSQYSVIGIDLAKTKYHVVALDHGRKRAFKKAFRRDEFFVQVSQLWPEKETFALEACGGAHFVGQTLQSLGHHVILLKPRDVKAYAKARQKNDAHDALAICKAALDPELKPVALKTVAQQEIAYLHTCRQQVISQRIQLSNGLQSALLEFGVVLDLPKASFARTCRRHITHAYEARHISSFLYQHMEKIGAQIEMLLDQERALDRAIVAQNKQSPKAQLLEKIPGIGPLNASILSYKPMEAYQKPRDFAASLGLVPKQHTTGGHIKLGSITKQGDRYARTMLIQAARTLVMRPYKKGTPEDALTTFIQRLRKAGKGFNLICVAVANKLARIAHACVMATQIYHPTPKKGGLNP